MSIPEHSNLSLYGKGVFTTVALCRSEPFLWEKHWKRLQGGSERLGVDISEYSERTVLTDLTKEIESSGIVNGRVRINFLDGSSSGLWGGKEKGTVLSILIGERNGVSDSFKLTTSRFRVNSTSPLAGVKSCNYLEPLMSHQEAHERGFDEAIRINERGEITSACMANVFWLKDGQLYTPSLKTGCLAGTTREYVLENLECQEIETVIDELDSADEIFLTSAGVGVVQVAEFDGKKLRRADHEILKILPF